MCRSNIEHSSIWQNILQFDEKTWTQSMILTCDVGGTTCKLAIFNEGQLLSMAKVPYSDHQSIESSMELILQTARQMAGSLEIPFDSITKIGLAFPGIIDVKNRRVLSINEKHPGILDFDFVNWASSNGFDTIQIENDARAALMGESFGNPELKHIEDCVGITLGTGIGVAAMIKGQLIHGSKYQATINMGHTIVSLDSPRCNCGGKGCAESHASTWALQKNTGYSSFQDLFAQVDKGKIEAVKTLESYIHTWAACLVNVSYAYDPEVIVLGGGVMNRHDLILPNLAEKMIELSWNGFVQPKIIRSTLLEKAALYGMVARVINESIG